MVLTLLPVLRLTLLGRHIIAMQLVTDVQAWVL